MNENIKKILESEKYDFLRTNKNLGDNIILLVISGSHAYGLDTPESDLDIRGIAVETEDVLFGLGHFEQYEDKETDTVIYSLRKFIQLTIKGSPNMLELLFIRPEDVLYSSEEGKFLLENRDLFLSKKIYHTIRGFTKNSIHRMEKYAETSTKRASKAAMHLVRLYLTGIEVLRTGKYPVYQGENIPMLKGIRNGRYIENDKIAVRFYDYLENFERSLTDAYEYSSLPDSVDQEAISHIQVLILRHRHAAKLASIALGVEVGELHE